MTKIAVTGIGIISAIGDDVSQTYDSLINCKTGISNIDMLSTKYREEFKVGEIKHSYQELIKIADVDESDIWTRTSLLGVIAAKQAIKDSGILIDANTALVSATTVGGMDRSELFYKDMLSGVHGEYIDTHHAGNSTEMIAKVCGISGVTTTISTACSSSLNSIIFGVRLINNKQAKRVIVGGTDALSKFTLNGFNTLMILDREHSRPFDETRTGLNLGEGAAYLVLEDYDSVLAQNKRIYGIVSGYANANDAHHQTASSDNGDGPFLSMRNAIEISGLKPQDISYINAHGTGTENNDLTESIALERLFKENVPPFSSTKAFTGHTLGAAGAVEAVISLLALNNNVAYPNVNFKNRIADVNISPVETLVNLDECNHVLTNSFGFGGNDSSVVFSKPDCKIENKVIQSNKVFISGLGCVSPQNSLENELTNIIKRDGNSAKFEILPPDYKDFIDPRQLRRMSKIVRMGMVASGIALKDSGIDSTEAIITGTGMGCQRDTEKFLNSMIENDEGLLTPTSFIQSTHNTIGGAIALSQKNHGYNLTYVHRTFSFESALSDGVLSIREGSVKNVLLGGFDETTDESWLIKTKIGHYKHEPVQNGNLFSDDQKGAVAGEGSAFFVISKERIENTYAEVIDVKTVLNNGNLIPAEIVDEFLQKNNLDPKNIDLVLYGRNGDKYFDRLYDDVEEALFKKVSSFNYKSLCGEYDTSSSFAMWLAAVIMKQNQLPKEFELENSKTKIDTVLIYNQFRNINHSLILLSK